MAKKVVKIPIYGGKLAMVITDTLEDAAKDCGVKADVSGYDAFVSYDNESDIFSLCLSTTDWVIISHEIVHVVNEIFLSRNIQLDRVNDEPQAYLTGWVAFEVDCFIKEQPQQEELTTKES